MAESEYRIRKSTLADVDAIMEIIDLAKEDMAASGSDQWQNGEPNADIIREDIRKGGSHVLVDADGKVQGTAYIIQEDEPDYAKAEEGSWRAESPYMLVHRVAVRRAERGKSLAWILMSCAIEQGKSAGATSVRIDTHPVNIPMQHFLTRHGFEKRVVINPSYGVRWGYEYLLR